MRLGCLLLVLTGCIASPVEGRESPLTGPSTPAVAPGTTDPLPDPPPPVDGEALAARYVDALCGLHATEACAESRAATCRDGLDLSEPTACRSLLLGTALACDGATDGLGDHAADVEACIAHLEAASCETSPACDEDGLPLDSTGPCAPVAQRLRAACEPLEDPE
jgi:hypothetical protein